MENSLIQTAFKFDAQMSALMKKRARSLGKSVNGYVRDIAEADMLPKVSYGQLASADVESLSGKFTNPDLNAINEDIRAKAIWER